MAHKIRIAVGASELEVPGVRREPRVEHFRDYEATISENQHARRLFAAVARVALDANAEDLIVPSRRQAARHGERRGRRPAANTFTRTTPPTKPPMCAMNATPPPDCGPWPMTPNALINWRTNHRPTAT